MKMRQSVFGSKKSFKQRRMGVIAAAGLMVVPNGDFLREKFYIWVSSKDECTVQRTRIAARPRIADLLRIADVPQFSCVAPNVCTTVHRRIYRQR
jgi:hypothetical protein